MKKVLIFLLAFISIIGNIYAKNKVEVKFSSCVDGDTAKFVLNNDIITVRFLAIDTPETKHPNKEEELFGKEASNYTCDKISKANEIYLEFDDSSDEKDKYDRYLSWIWVDGYLLQDELIKEGLAETAYLYGDYKYTGLLEDHQIQAKLNKKGKWGELPTTNYWLYVGGIAGAIILGVLYGLGKINKKTYNKGMKIAKKYSK